MCQRLVHAVVASPVAVQAVQDDSAFGSVPRSEYIRVLQNIMNTDGSTVGDEVRQQREQVSFVLFLIENK